MKLNTTTKIASVAVLSTLLFACNSGSSGSNTPKNKQPRNSNNNPKNTNDAKSGYAAVIDCGSKGTRVYLYQFDATNPNTNISIVEKYENKLDLPMASYGTNPQSAGTEVIKPLLDSVITELKTISPTTQLSDVEVFVGGTAGMRLIPVEQQNAIWTEVKQTAQNEGFTNSNAITITGQDEGLYSWMDFNFVDGNHFSSASTKGTIEVGGASAQVAFSSSSTGEHIRSYDILGKTYNIYSTSFLGFGVNQARAELDVLPTANTCYPSGYTSTNSPTFNGSFNFADCNTSYTGIISAYNGDVVPTSIKDVAGFSDTQFAGLGNIWDTVKLGSNSPAQQALKKANRIKNKPITTEGLQSVIKEECARSLTDITNDFGGAAGDGVDAPTFCANAVFSNNFVFNSLGVQDGKIQGYNNIANSTVSPTGDEVKVNWTLGYLLNEHFATTK